MIDRDFEEKLQTGDRHVQGARITTAVRAAARNLAEVGPKLIIDIRPSLHEPVVSTFLLKNFYSEAPVQPLPNTNEIFGVRHLR